MEWLTQQANPYINRKIRRTLYSRQVRAKPLMYFLTGHSHHQARMLYEPYSETGDKRQANDNYGFGASIGGDYGLAQRLKTLGSLEHEVRFQKATPDSGSHVTKGGDLPTATVNADELVDMMATRWRNKTWPLQVTNMTLRQAKGKFAIASVLDEAYAMGFEKAFGQDQTEFWNGTLTQTQQNAQEWVSNIGLRHWVSDGVDHTTKGGPDESAYAYVGRVDRTETDEGQDSLKAKVLWTEGDEGLIKKGYLSTTVPSLSLIRKVRTINALGGLSNYGTPAAGNLTITTPELFNVLADQADNQHVVIYPGQKVPNLRHSIGFENEVIVNGRNFITYDNDCPEGEMYILSTASFMYEVMPGMNYFIQPWDDESKSKRGGKDIHWTNIRLNDRLTCVMPWLNVKIVGLTAH